VHTHDNEAIAHPWRIVDACDGQVVATAADRSVAMVWCYHLLMPEGPYSGLTIECDGFRPVTLRGGAVSRHVREEYLADRFQFMLRLMDDRLRRIAADASQLAVELSAARDALQALSNDLIDDPDDLAALNDVGRRIVDRYGGNPLLSGWYADLDLVRDAADLHGAV